MKETKETLFLEHKHVDILACKVDRYDSGTQTMLPRFSWLIQAWGILVGGETGLSRVDVHWEGLTYGSNLHMRNPNQ